MATAKIDTLQYRQLFTLLTDSDLKPLIQALEKLEQRFDSLMTAVTKQTEAVSQGLAPVVAGISQLSEQLAEMGETLKKVAKDVESASENTAKALEKSAGTLETLFLNVVSGIITNFVGAFLSKIPFKGLLQKFGLIIKGMFNPRSLETDNPAGSSKRRKPGALIKRRGPGTGGTSDAGHAGDTGSKTVPKVKGGKGGKGAALAALGSLFAAWATDSLMAADGVDAFSSSLDGGVQGASVLAGVMELLMSGLALAGPIISGVGTAISVVGTALRTMGAIAMANPVAAVIGAIAAAALLIITNWDSVCNFFATMAEKISSALSTVKTYLLGLIPDWLKDLLGIDGGKGLGATISEAKENLGKAISDALPSMDSIIDGISGAGENLKNFGSGIADSVGNFFGNIFDGDASQGLSPATDANGIANEIGGAVERRMIAACNRGVCQ